LHIPRKFVQNNPKTCIDVHGLSSKESRQKSMALLSNKEGSSKNCQVFNGT
jgi:hypothetical protein